MLSCKIQGSMCKLYQFSIIIYKHWNLFNDYGTKT